MTASGVAVILQRLGEKLQVFRNPDSSERLATILVGISVAGANMLGLPVAPGVVEALVSGGGIVSDARRGRKTDVVKVLEDFKQQLERNWRDWARQASDLDEGQLERLAAEFEEVLPFCVLTPAEVANKRLDPDGIAAAVLDRAAAARPVTYADANPNNGEAALHRAFLRSLVRNAYQHLIAQPRYFEIVTPELWRKLLSGQDRLEEAINRIPTDIGLTIADRERLFEQAVRAQTDLGATQTLLAGFLQTILGRKVPPEQFAEVLFQLASQWRIAGERVDAMARSQVLAPELESLREQAKAAHLAEDSECFWRLLSQIETVEQESLDRLDRYILEVQQERDLRRAGLVETKRAKVAAAVAAYRPAEVAKLLIEIAELQTGEPNKLFEAVCAMRDEWFERGRHGGISLELEVTIELAEACRSRASGNHQRQDATHDLALIMWTLGEREGSGERLEAAVCLAARSAVIARRIGDDLRRVNACNSLANVLSALGEREPGTRFLRLALRRYRRALQWLGPLSSTPLGASCMLNYGQGLALLGEREHDRFQRFARLAEAARQFEFASEIFLSNGLFGEWASAKNNLGNALKRIAEENAAHHNYMISVINFRSSFEAFGEALSALSKDDHPFFWAQVKKNLGLANYAFGNIFREEAELDEAAILIREALEVMSPENMPLEWASATGILGCVQRSIADINDDLVLALTALENLRTAVNGLRSGRQMSWAEGHAREIPAAEALVRRLGGEV